MFTDFAPVPYSQTQGAALKSKPFITEMVIREAFSNLMTS